MIHLAMAEGTGGSFDAGRARPYENRPLPPGKVEFVQGRMHGFPAGLEYAADQLRRSDGILGRRVALGLQGGSRNVEDALIAAGQVVDMAREDRTWRFARSPQELQ